MISFFSIIISVPPPKPILIRNGRGFFIKMIGSQNYILYLPKLRFYSSVYDPKVSIFLQLIRNHTLILSNDTIEGTDNPIQGDLFIGEMTSTLAGPYRCLAILHYFGEYKEFILEPPPVYSNTVPVFVIGMCKAWFTCWHKALC